ncbi:hypothetical protein N7539_006919 [Penicillium diatomitis]|uniref:Uncharacterized protein n=1 Tax=Penicillium diatomitis TaxID=2819901 RepID=A0A9X0BSD9_9EURO|nr:uncharacterized protein N7539_006919 [Penicillium diatomitis]KAJ5481025.1 hypothetical protein N7539_006919 [Penicillium diatomitis]
MKPYQHWPAAFVLMVTMISLMGLTALLGFFHWAAWTVYYCWRENFYGRAIVPDFIVISDEANGVLVTQSLKRFHFLPILTLAGTTALTCLETGIRTPVLFIDAVRRTHQRREIFGRWVHNSASVSTEQAQV